MQVVGAHGADLRVFIVVSAPSEKTRFFFRNDFSETQRGPGTVLGRAFGAPLASQGPLGKAVQVHCDPFGGSLDRQKMSMAQFLMEILG